MPVVLNDEILEKLLQLADAFERLLLEPLARQNAKEALDKINP